MVWPTYPQPSSHVLLPPIPPPPLAPLQLLSSPAQPTDYLATSTTLHQHTTQHSTRLVALTTTTDNKRKVPLPISGHTLIKIEADCTATSTLDSKAVQQTVSTVSSNSGTVFTENSAPLLTTHVIYQHPANLIFSQSTETSCKSQATSPVTLTPPPEIAPVEFEEESLTQDASNQTEIIEEPPKVEETPKPIIEVKKTSELVRIPTPVPEVVNDIENDVKIYNKPDISGLELLSNSIVEYEICRKLSTELPVKYEAKEETEEEIEEQGDEVLQGIAHMTIKDKEVDSYPKNLDDNLGGLNLLCALAEQRLEEVLEKQNDEDYKHYKQYKKPKDFTEEKKLVIKTVKSNKETKRKYDGDNKSFESNLSDKELEKIRENERELEKEKLNVLKRVTGERGIIDSDNSPSFGAIEIYDKKKTDSKKETDEVIKTCSCVEEKNSRKRKENDTQREWSPTFISEVKNMRQKIADLHRQYKKQLELSKLTPKTTECGDCSKRIQQTPKKIKEDRSPSPPLLDKMDNSPVRYRTPPDLLRPPTLCAVVAPSENIIKKIINNDGDVPIESTQKRKSSPDSTPEKISSSKKRKVGRPKKLMSAPGLRVVTETIVAKKPKKNSIVGFLLAAKNRLQLQNNNKNSLTVNKSPPRYTEEKPKHKTIKNQHNNNNNINKMSSTTITTTTIPCQDLKKKKHKTSKIRPKLKAEPKVKKIIQQEEEECSEWEVTMPVEEELLLVKPVSNY